MTKVSLPVLIVGTGPVGLFQAHALAKLGVPVIIVGRHLQRLGAPKAHALAPRSLEICRQFGISVPEIRQHPACREDARWVRFVTSLSGEEVGCLPYERMSLDVLDATPEMLHNIAQPDFEALVLREIQQNDQVDLRQGWTWISSTEIESLEEDSHVVSLLRNTYTGEEVRVKSAFVIGCDGANSRIRKAMNISSDGEDSTETMMTIHFSANLRSVVKKRIGMLHWIMDPGARGFIIAYDLSGNQVLIHNFDSKYHPLDSFTPEKCRSIVQAAIGQDVELKIHSNLPWLLRRQVANQYYKSRVILAGDSAHSFPPTGGLGLNSGLADAHNLASKISLIYRGIANWKTMLQLYEDERRPVAVRNAMQSVTNGKKIFSLLKALKNTDPNVDLARRQMTEALANPEQRALIQTLIADQMEHFDNLMLHIGYVYEPNWDPINATDYIPAYRTGARLPHAWIQPKNSGVLPIELDPVDLEFLRGDLEDNKIAKWKFSTLDLVHRDSFLLICYRGSTWASASVKIVSQCRSAGIKLNVAIMGEDFDLVDECTHSKWAEGLQLPSGAATVVRPDQHIAFICNKDDSPDKVVTDLLQSLK